jgi:hypothetical protein
MIFDPSISGFSGEVRIAYEPAGLGIESGAAGINRGRDSVFRQVRARELQLAQCHRYVLDLSG